jgi:hypothetical protein
MNVIHCGSAPPAHASAAPTIIGTAAMVSVRGRMPSNQTFGRFAAASVSEVSGDRIVMKVAAQNP